MKITRPTRSKVLTLAHAIKKEGIAFGKAQRKAWVIIRLKAAMRAASVVFTFLKSDGTTRRAKGTLPAYTPSKTASKPRKTNPLQIKYFDE